MNTETAMNRTFLSNKSGLKKYAKKSFTDSSNIGKHQNSIIIKQNILLNHFPTLNKKYGQLEPNDIKQFYKKINNIILYIDIFSFIADFFVVTALYFNHFDYNKHGYKTNKSDNILRFICLFISISIVLSLIIRYVFYKQFQNIKFMLSLRAKVPSQKTKYIKLLAEIIVHLIQPYPYLSCNFSLEILGYDVTYSLDMILFSLSIIRLYVIFKIIKVYNLYTNSRSQKINLFFGNKNIWTFLYRTNLKSNSFTTLALIFSILVLAGSYLFKVYENYQQDEDSSDFGNFFNCLWFIAQTNVNLGYGDYVPDTLVGRIIAGVVCMSGVFLKSLFTVSMLMFILVIDENEKKAYSEINLLYKKEEINNGYNIYFNNYIKSKFSILLGQFKKRNLMDNIHIKIGNKIIKEKYYLRLLASMKIPLTLSEFCNFIKTQWEPQAEDTIEWYKDRIDICHNFNDFICDNIHQYQNDVLNCFITNTKMVNLVSFIFLCGNMFPVESHNDVKGDNIVSLKQFEKKIKEFHLTFNERRIYTKDNNIHNENDKKRCSLFTNSFDTREQVKDNNFDDGELTSKDELNISDIYETESSYSINNKSNYSD